MELLTNIYCAEMASASHPLFKLVRLASIERSLLLDNSASQYSRADSGNPPEPCWSNQILIKASSAQKFFSGDCTLTLEFKYFLTWDMMTWMTCLHVMFLVYFVVMCLRSGEGFTIIKKKYNNQALVKFFFFCLITFISLNTNNWIQLIIMQFEQVK